MAEDNNNKNTWSQQNIVIMVLLGVVIVLLAANLFKAPAIQVVETGGGGDIEADRSSKKTERGRDEDPYIANQVKNTIVKGYIPIRDCYNAFVAKKPATTDGKITIDWTIKENGRVSKAELVSSELGDDELSQCMVKQIVGFKFPPPPGGREKYVDHKFFFKKDPETK